MADNQISESKMSVTPGTTVTLTVSEDHNQILSKLFDPHYTPNVAVPLHKRNLPPSFFLQPSEDKHSSTNHDDLRLHPDQSPFHSKSNSSPACLSYSGSYEIPFTSIQHQHSPTHQQHAHPQNVTSALLNVQCKGELNHIQGCMRVPNTAATQHVKSESLSVNEKKISIPNRKNIFEICPLEPNYELALNSSEQVYFLNHETQQTTWFDPRLPLECQRWGMSLVELENLHKMYASTLQVNNNNNGTSKVVSGASEAKPKVQQQESLLQPPHSRSFSQPVSGSFQAPPGCYFMPDPNLLHQFPTSSLSPQAYSQDLHPPNPASHLSSTHSPLSPSGQIRMSSSYSPNSMFLSSPHAAPPQGLVVLESRSPNATLSPYLNQMIPSKTTSPSTATAQLLFNSQPGMLPHHHHLHPQPPRGMPQLSPSQSRTSQAASTCVFHQQQQASQSYHSHQSSVDSGVGTGTHSTPNNHNTILQLTPEFALPQQQQPPNVGALSSVSNPQRQQVHSNMVPCSSMLVSHPGPTGAGAPSKPDDTFPLGDLNSLMLIDEPLNFDDLPDLSELDLDLPMESPSGGGGAMQVQ